MQQSSPPVQVGDEFDVSIEAVGEKGDGIAKVKGFVLFVANTKEGEHCRVRVTKVLTKVGFAEKIGEALNPPKPKKEYGPVAQPIAKPEYEDTEDFGEELEEDSTIPQEQSVSEESSDEQPSSQESSSAQSASEEEPKKDAEESSDESSDGESQSDDLDEDIPPPPPQ